MHTDDEREYLDTCRVRCGLPRIGFPQPHLPRRSAFAYENLALTEWSPTFEQYMRNRLIIGAMRYGLLKDPRKRGWDRVSRILVEVEAYREDRNKERLVDIANMCLLEFEEGYGYFTPTDDAGFHTNPL